MVDPPHQQKNNHKKGKKKNQGQGENPPNKSPKLGETNANPNKTPKGEAIMVNPEKGEIETLEPITLVHYVANMAIALTISRNFFIAKR